MAKIAILVVLSIFPVFSEGKVRKVFIDDGRMHPVSLNLGYSTVLRFEDPPQKIVVGNQNYFNIEYTGKDLTIQPLDIVVTNLFVYTKRHAFGFILNVREGEGRDDLVKIFLRLPKVPMKKRTIVNLKTSGGISGKVVVAGTVRGLGFADISLFNTLDRSLRISRLEIILSGMDGKRRKLKKVFAKDRIAPKESVHLRIFFKRERSALKLDIRVPERSKEVLSTKK